MPTRAEHSLACKMLWYGRLAGPRPDVEMLIDEFRAAEDWDVASLLPRSTLRSLFHPPDASALLVFLRNRVWTNRHRALFWLEAPLDRFCYTLAVGPGPLTLDAVLVLVESLARGADEERLAASLHAMLNVPSVVEELAPPVLVEVCALVATLMGRAGAREAIGSFGLLRRFGKALVWEDASTAPEPVVAAAVLRIFVAGQVTCLAASDAAEGAARVLDRNPSPEVARREDHRLALALLEALSTRAEWHTVLKRWVVSLAREEWPHCYAALVANMLRTPSVEFLLLLRERRKLAGLVRVCLARGGEWEAVLSALRAAWPEEVDAALGATDPVKKEAEGGGGVRCPITLDRCVHPVVASDGHTYERDALLRLMAEGGEAVHPLSPVTREPLLPFLYRNRAVER